MTSTRRLFSVLSKRFQLKDYETDWSCIRKKGNISVDLVLNEAGSQLQNSINSPEKITLENLIANVKNKLKAYQSQPNANSEQLAEAIYNLNSRLCSYTMGADAYAETSWVLMRLGDMANKLKGPLPHNFIQNLEYMTTELENAASMYALSYAGTIQDHIQGILIKLEACKSLAEIKHINYTLPHYADSQLYHLAKEKELAVERLNTSLPFTFLNGTNTLTKNLTQQLANARSGMDLLDAARLQHQLSIIIASLAGCQILECVNNIDYTSPFLALTDAMYLPDNNDMLLNDSNATLAIIPGNSSAYNDAPPSAVNPIYEIGSYVLLVITALILLKFYFNKASQYQPITQNDNDDEHRITYR